MMNMIKIALVILLCGKKAEDGEPSWPAKFTDKGRSISMPGRPGWHIECSAMRRKAIGGSV